MFDFNYTLEQKLLICHALLLNKDPYVDYPSLLFQSIESALKFKDKRSINIPPAIQNKDSWSVIYTWLLLKNSTVTKLQLGGIPKLIADSDSVIRLLEGLKTAVSKEFDFVLKVNNSKDVDMD